METKSGKEQETKDVPEKIELTEKDKEEKDQNESKKDKKKKEKKEKVKKETTKRSLDACAQNFTVGLNVLDRDEKRINDHVNVQFEDIIGEPDPTHGFEFIWRLTFLIFNVTRFWVYRFVAAILAIPFALFWAIIFAFINISTIWCCTPSLRVFDLLLHYVHRVWSGLIRTLLDPIFSSAGLLFNNMRSKRETIAV